MVVIQTLIVQIHPVVFTVPAKLDMLEMELPVLVSRKRFIIATEPPYPLHTEKDDAINSCQDDVLISSQCGIINSVFFHNHVHKYPLGFIVLQKNNISKYIKISRKLEKGRQFQWVLTRQTHAPYASSAV